MKPSTEEFYSRVKFKQLATWRTTIAAMDERGVVWVYLFDDVSMTWRWSVAGHSEDE